MHSVPDGLPETDAALARPADGEPAHEPGAHEPGVAELVAHESVAHESGAREPLAIKTVVGETKLTEAGAGTGETSLGDGRDAQERPAEARLRYLAGKYIFVGTIIGFALPPIAIFFGLGAAAVFIDKFLGIAIARMPLAVMLGALLSGLVVGVSSHGTCWREPVAPRAIAIGLAVGGAVLLVVALVQAEEARDVWMVISASVLSTVCMIVGSNIGANRAIRKNLGLVRKGVGLTCARCAYDLSGTPQDWPCPECGHTMRFEKSMPGT